VIASESRLRLRTRLDRDNKKRPVRSAMQRVALAMCTLVVLIASSGAAAAQSEIAISGTVTTRADGLSVPHAVVSVGGANLTATSDANGRYTLIVPASLVRDKQLKLRVDALGLRPTLIDVVVDAPAVTVDVALTLDFSEQMTVGSRATRTEAEKAVPVDVLTQEQIASSGYVETAQIIQSLAPSLNFPRPTITDGTDTVRPATLRGLGPDQVLVLVNGKRRHQSALVHLNGSIGRGSTGVDLNAIPVSAIDRIEILRDGAAAQYGSDAIAGVINIVLKSGVARPNVNSSFGLSTGSFTGNQCTADGQSCEEGNPIDFSDGGLVDVGGSWGIAAGKGSVTVAAEYRHHNRTNRASFDPRDQVAQGDGGNNPVAQPNHRWGDPDTRDAMTFVNANLPLNAAETHFLYAFGGVSRRAANSAGFYRRALDARNWPQIYPFGFLPVIEPTVIDVSATSGVQGLHKKWSYDASFGYGRNSLAFTIGDTLNVSLGPRVPPNKPEFDAGTLLLNQIVGNADASRHLEVRGFDGPLNVAFGLEFRREHYQIQAGEPDSYGDGGVPNQFGGRAAIGAQVFPGFRPSNEVNESRNNVAGYLDVEGNLTSWLRLGAAGRAEHYSDFGSTVDGKVTARVQPDSHIVVRGSISTGFRAPSLAQSFFSSTATNFLNFGQGLVPVESLTLPVNSAPAQVLGAAPLKPENSRHASGGVVIAPLSDLEVTIDYYHIAIDDRIVLSGNFTAPPIAALLAPFGANSARFFTNAIDTRTNGVDVTASYRVRMEEAGDLWLRAGYNNTRTRIVGSIATPPQLAGFESVLFDRIEQRRIECGQPSGSGRFGINWRRQRAAVNLDLNRFGTFCSFTLNPADDQEFGAKWLTDVEGAYLAGVYTLSVGAQNLFDLFPDRNITVNSFNGIQTFPSHSPFGMNGRTVYGRISWMF
jgi:iron complex outermembrane receptor protein